MTINKFAVLIAKKEGGKKEVDIAQIKEILRIIKDLLLDRCGIDIYFLIRRIMKK